MNVWVMAASTAAKTSFPRCTQAFTGKVCRHCFFRYPLQPTDWANGDVVNMVGISLLPVRQSIFFFLSPLATSRQREEPKSDVEPPDFLKRANEAFHTFEHISSCPVHLRNAPLMTAPAPTER